MDRRKARQNLFYRTLPAKAGGPTSNRALEFNDSSSFPNTSYRDNASYLAINIIYYHSLSFEHENMIHSENYINYLKLFM